MLRKTLKRNAVETIMEKMQNSSKQKEELQNTNSSAILYLSLDF